MKNIIKIAKEILALTEREKDIIREDRVEKDLTKKLMSVLPDDVQFRSPGLSIRFPAKNEITIIFRHARFDEDKDKIFSTIKKVIPTAKIKVDRKQVPKDERESITLNIKY